MTPTTVTPTLVASRTALPPEGANFSRGGPSKNFAGSPLLAVKGLRVSFGGNEVVRGIDFSIAPGEKLAIVGESGSGKTVTALSLLRLLQDAQVRGEVMFRGLDSTNAGQAEVDLLTLPMQAMRGIRGRDIAMIFQEPMTALNPLMTINRQIAEVIEEKQGKAVEESRLLAIELIAKTGISEPQRRSESYPHQLSGGQRQRAMIAMALACKPKLLLADEPTTALDVTVRAQILDLITELQKENGMAVVMITHDLNLVRRFADRVAIMENGLIVEQGTVAEVFATPKHAYTQKLINSTATRDVVEIAPTTPAGESVAPALLVGKSLQVAYPVPIPGIKGWFKKGRFVAVKGADFTVRAGQTLGVVGESGSGKSTLALAALGLLPFEGELRLNGQSWQDKSKALALRKTMQVVFQDPFSSLSPRLTVAEIVGEGLLVHAPLLTKEERRTQVLKALQDVGLTELQFPALLERYPHEFSGGQRQRMAIARALIVEPQLLVLDEPTSALDVTIQKQVLALLQGLQRQRGLSYLLITHDVAVIRAMAHHVIVMRDAQILESGEMAQVFSAPKNDYTRTLLEAAA
jgi:microcin C transport system ATP-binding protein